MSFNKIILILFFLIYNNSALADSKLDLGLDIFNNKAQCGTCHTLKAANSDGVIGPNLDMLDPTIPQTINAVTNGIGVMPPWGDILTKEEIEAVAYYIFNSTSN
jgi:cytochrome c6